MRVIYGINLLVFLTASLALAGQQQIPIPLFHAQTNLVVVDVTVTDSHGRPVHGLTAGDFVLFEDRQAQVVKSFEVHESSDSQELTPLPVLPAGTYSNQPVAPANGALNVLLLDRLNTPMKDQSYVLRQLKDFLDHMPAGTRIAIFGLNSRLNMLQGFTSDPAVLRKFLDSDKGRLAASVILNNAVSGDKPGTQKMGDDLLRQLEQENDPYIKELVKKLIQIFAEQETVATQRRARITLDAMNQLARYLAGFKGRKNLLWFSSSFPVNIMPDKSLLNPFGVVMSVNEEFRETSALLTRSQVAVYPIDARGLVEDSVFEAANAGARSTGPSRNLRSFLHDENEFHVQINAELDTMRQMAEDTGGEAFINGNGLTRAAIEAIADGSNYYTLSYTPSNTVWRGEYRRVKVKVARPGVRLAYRRGYFADDARGAVQSARGGEATNPLANYDPVQAAMMFGAPAPTELVFQASVSRVPGAPEPTVAEENHADPNQKGPFVRYEVRYKLKLDDLSCAKSSRSTYECKLELIARLFNEDGAMKNFLVSGRSVTLAADDVDASHKGVYNVTQQISVPAKGDYVLRVGVEDLGSKKIGAIELPLAAVHGEGRGN